MKFLLIFFLMSFSEVGEQPKNPVQLNDPVSSGEHRSHYSTEGQEQCEEMCLKCVSAGEEPEECAENIFFKICCHKNGGHARGCGCREGL